MNRSNLAEKLEHYYTVEKYLSFEREAAAKSEYIDGEIVAMAGATRAHNLISLNAAAEIRFQLKGRKCEVYANDMRVRMRGARYGYPDVVVVCGEPQFADNEFDVLLNPTVVVEVLSDSTRFRDKTEKLETYLAMESVRECLLIEQNKMRVEQYVKQTPKQWLLRIYENADEAIDLSGIGCNIPLTDIYAQVEFAPEESDNVNE
jgi:Uma2 family endonuclease